MGEHMEYLMSITREKECLVLCLLKLNVEKMQPPIF